MAPFKNRFWSSPFVRLSAYYVAAGMIAFGLISLFPNLFDAFSMERLRALAENARFTDTGVTTQGTSDVQLNDPVALSLMATLAIVGDLVLLAPVAWVYMLTKQEKGYDESVVHTVIILPVAVTGLVIVVQNSLALAFSLAGIVAAVRFRNTLEDTKDAVYIFLAIGTALAAGAQALGIAAVTSVIFNYLVLATWRFKIGNMYADQLSRVPKMRLGDVLAGAGTPGAGTGNLTIGDPSMLAALTPNSLGEIAERKAKLRDHIESAGKKKFNGLLIILADGHESCMDAIDEVLEQSTDRFKLAEVSPMPDGNSTLEYLIGLPKTIAPPELVAGLRRRAGQHIIAAEFRALGGRKSKEAKKTDWNFPRA